MFKQLRNRFLILNLVIISVLMLIAFGTIYIITYGNVQQDIDNELSRVSDLGIRGNDKFREPRISDNPLFPGLDLNPGPQEPSASFTIFTDIEGKEAIVFSIFEMNTSFYESAKRASLASNRAKGRFRLESKYWAYAIHSHPLGYRIVFLDITSRQAILTNLIYTFLLVSLVMLVCIFFISRFFANKSIRPIKEAFEKQKQFISDASHELKTPLAVINTNIDVLLANGEDTINSQAKWLYYIKSEAERMSTLTKDLLYLAHVDYSENKMVFSEFNLSECVENIILTMEAVIFENNIGLDYSIEPNIIFNGNSEQIKQVVMILLDNAIKYTNTKGLITISLKKQLNAVSLSVTNTGSGISKEHMDKLFDRFYRIDKSRDRESGGYGLGLSIAKAIVDSHKGRITIKSIINKSSTFIVELPIN